jgi:guanine deaminase
MSTNQNAFILRGQTFAFRDDPFMVPPDDAVAFETDGAILIDGGLIKATGTADAILRDNPDLEVRHTPDHLIMAGFVDCHAHYPQYEIIASYGEQLLEWLDRYTFPAELKFSDPAYARRIADLFLDACLRNGTTTASVYPTVHPSSVETFFEAAEARSMRMACGKVMMDRNAPAGLCDTPQSSYDEAKALLTKWHDRARLTYVVTPRFAVTSTAEQLAAAGALWAEHPTTLMQTHASENHAEIALVASLFPDCPDYIGVYEKFGLVGSGANFGHAIHLSDREFGVLDETGSGVSHCPTSNLFLGSGLMNLGRMRAPGSRIELGLATDIGGGSSVSMLHTMRAAYEVQRLQGYSLHPVKAYYLATVGSAKTLRLDHAIGNIAPGMDADLIVVDLKSTPQIAHRMAHADTLWDALFVQMIMADDRAIAATYIAGKSVSPADRGRRENR